MAGNAADAFSNLPPPASQIASVSAKAAFVSGFSSVLYFAALLAAISSLLVFVLTKPVRVKREMSDRANAVISE
ncbi:hypothetical protein [Collimonas silvisoli]|uniref:hypothetical protein n=1 Tax=Collimonas silvisoli TaxID=2825884 RepID=UPI001B8AF345|nr:hypothetical protein [Collimonas silvisoli]